MAEENYHNTLVMFTNLNDFYQSFLLGMSERDYNAMDNYRSLIVSTRENLQLLAAGNDGELKEIIEEGLKIHIKLCRALDIWGMEK